MKIRLAMLGLGLLAAAGCGGGARHVPASEATSAAQMEAVAAILREAGLEASVFDAHSVVLSREGINVLVFREDGGASLQAVFACTRVGLGQAADVAAWNAGRRFGRAYLDADGRPVLASDLALEPPVSPAVVASWGELLLDMARRFVIEVWPPPAQRHLDEPVINE